MHYMIWIVDKKRTLEKSEKNCSIFTTMEFDLFITKCYSNKWSYKYNIYHTNITYKYFAQLGQILSMDMQLLGLFSDMWFICTELNLKIDNCNSWTTSHHRVTTLYKQINLSSIEKRLTVTILKQLFTSVN